jgi:hypothetical protein
MPILKSVNPAYNINQIEITPTTIPKTKKYQIDQNRKHELLTENSSFISRKSIKMKVFFFKDFFGLHRIFFFQFVSKLANMN